MEDGGVAPKLVNHAHNAITLQGRGGAEEALLLSFSGQSTLTIHPPHPGYRKESILTCSFFFSRLLLLLLLLMMRNSIPSTTRWRFGGAKSRRLKSDQATTNRGTEAIVVTLR